MHPWLEDLDRLKTQFGGTAARGKKALLSRARRARIDDADDLQVYHETLCFLRAFPDDPEILEVAETELRRFSSRVRGFEEELAGTGIAGTTYAYPFGLPMATWLVDRFGDAVDIDWDIYEERDDDNMAAILSPVAGWVETAALDDEELTAREWFDRSRGKRRAGALRRLIDRLRTSDLPAETQEALYNILNVQVVWQLGDGPASRTLARMPQADLFYHSEPLRGRTGDLRAEIRSRLPRLRPVSRPRARAWIDLARRALSVRDRELYPLALAHEAEVYEASVGRGVRIVLFGMLPARRLPIETDYGAFVVKNGVPIGYGVGALLFEQLEIAVNIFPTFRSGESSFVFEQFTRLFHNQFDCRAFMVERYQLGHENDEGIDAGSFWFYHKLGFRPVDSKVERLAAAEAARISKEPGYRTPRSVLKRLARSNVILRLDDGACGGAQGISLTGIGLAVSRLIEERFDGDCAKAQRVCAGEAARSLGLGSLGGWSKGEREAFARLSPLIRLIPGLRSWPRAERERLIDLVRAKGAKAEADYARGMIEFPLFRAALTVIGRGDGGESARS
jgi:hypothetical protein